jgi:hypothetical protein
LKLGRYSFNNAIQHFLDRKEGIWKASIMFEEKRKLELMGRTLEELHEQGKASTTDPRHMTRKDIQAFMANIKTID